MSVARDVEGLIREAATVLSDAMDEAAAIALLAKQKYGAQLQSFCKKVAEEAGMPEAWDALRRRTYRLQEGRSEGVAERAAAREGRAIRRLVREPSIASAIPHGDKVQLARALLGDAEVAEDALREPTTWTGVMRSASRLEAEPSPTAPRARSRQTDSELNVAWREWLNQLNTVLMRGAGLEERTEREGVTLDVYGESGRLMYQRITERKLDAEIRELFELQERGERR